METIVYANRIETGSASQNPVYHHIKSIVKVISDNQSERIIFQNGEIELTAFQDELKICSKSYLKDGKTLVTGRITKKVIPGYNPLVALYNAKMSILQRVTDLEMRVRAEATAQQMRSRFKLEYGFGARKQESEATKNPFDPDTLEKIADAYERIAV